GRYLPARLPGPRAEGNDQARHPPGEPGHARNQEALQSAAPAPAPFHGSAAPPLAGAALQPGGRRAAAVGGAPAPALRRIAHGAPAHPALGETGERGPRLARSDDRAPRARREELGRDGTAIRPGTSRGGTRCVSAPASSGW